MPVRNANARWDGKLENGNGTMRFADYAGPFTFASRFEEGAGTNPEELIGGAIAGCYSMALSGDLGGAGYDPQSVETTAEVEVRPDPAGGFSITNIRLKTTASVSGIDDAEFQKIAAGTKEGCPVSKALSVPISLEATLK